MTAHQLAAALTRRPITPKRLRNFARVAKSLATPVVIAALAAIPDAAVRAQAAAALRDAGVEA